MNTSPSHSVKLLIAHVWDVPTCRAAFVRSWKAAKADSQLHGNKWQWVRGPVGAAWVSLHRVQAEWPSPFVVRLLGNDVNLLEVPPQQVKAIVQAHARRHLDLQLLEARHLGKRS